MDAIKHKELKRRQMKILDEECDCNYTEICEDCGLPDPEDIQDWCPEHW